MKIKLVVSTLLIVAACGLAYLLYDSIMQPVRFEDDFKKRSEAVVVKLKEIRTLEEAYKFANSRYCGDIDSLILFLETGKVFIIQKIGDVPDSLTEAQALKAGIIKRDTVWMNPLEKLREEKKINITDEQLTQLKYIPHSENKTFEIQAGFVDKSGLEVPVFEVKAPFSSFLIGMDEQMVANKIAETEQLKRYPGWKVGSMEQPITEGNFE